MGKLKLSLVLALLCGAGCQQEAPQASSPAAPVVADQSAAPPVEHDPLGSRDAFPFNLLVVGTEPFWTVKVSGKALEFTTPETVNQPRQWLGQREVEGSTLHMRGGEGDSAYVLTLHTQTCSDGMSDLEYAYSATFALAGQTYRGCARDAAVEVAPQ